MNALNKYCTTTIDNISFYFIQFLKKSHKNSKINYIKIKLHKWYKYIHYAFVSGQDFNSLNSYYKHII